MRSVIVASIIYTRQILSAFCVGFPPVCLDQSGHKLVAAEAGTFCQSKHYNLDDADWLETASKHNFCFQISIFQCWSSDRMGCNASNYSPWRTMLSRAFSENRRMILLLHGENTP